MNTTVNVGLQVIATGLIATGAATIGANLLAGSVEVILGIIAYAIYELTPSK